MAGCHALAVPPYVGALVYIAILGPRGYVEDWLAALTGVDGRYLPLPDFFSLGGTAFALSLFTYPYVYLMAAAALRSFNPALEEHRPPQGTRSVARSGGSSCPFARRSAAVSSWSPSTYSDFGTVSLMRYDTFTSAIYQQFTHVSTLLGGLNPGDRTRPDHAGRALGARPFRGSQGLPDRIDMAAPQLKAGSLALCRVLFVLFVFALSLFIPIGILIYWTIDGLTDSSTASEVWSYSDHSIHTYAWNSLWTAGLAATSHSYRPAARAPGRTFQQSFHAGLRGFRKPVMPSPVWS